MDLDCTTDKYGTLYAPWLANPGKLLDLAGFEPGMRVLDLCGGTGAISLECIRRGANPSDLLLLDLNPRCPDERVPQAAVDANRLWDYFRGRQPECHGAYDLIVIRQAVAYLDWNTFMLAWLSGLLARDGKLVFNTFVKPRWSFKTYKFNGQRFFEASGYIGRTVAHLQASPGLGLDLTKFHWWTPDYLHKRLEVWFDVTQQQVSGKSARFICTHPARRRNRPEPVP